MKIFEIFIKIYEVFIYFFVLKKKEIFLFCAMKAQKSSSDNAFTSLDNHLDTFSEIINKFKSELSKFNQTYNDILQEEKSECSLESLEIPIKSAKAVITSRKNSKNQNSLDGILFELQEKIRLSKNQIFALNKEIHVDKMQNARTEEGVEGYSPLTLRNEYFSSNGEINAHHFYKGFNGSKQQKNIIRKIRSGSMDCSSLKEKQFCEHEMEIFELKESLRLEKEKNLILTQQNEILQRSLQDLQKEKENPQKNASPATQKQNISEKEQPSSEESEGINDIDLAGLIFSFLTLE